MGDQGQGTLGKKFGWQNALSSSGSRGEIRKPRVMIERNTKVSQSATNSPNLHSSPLLAPHVPSLFNPLSLPHDFNCIYTNVEVTGEQPEARLLQSTTVTNDGNVFYYGGKSPNTGATFKDYYLFNPKKLTYIPYSESISPSPGPRAGHSTIYDKTTNEIYIFGGETDSSENASNELWKFNLANCTWTLLGPLSTHNENNWPTPRSGHSCILHFNSSNTPRDSSRQILIFGGVTDDNLYSSQLWTYNIATNSFRLLSNSSNPNSPSKRFHSIFGSIDSTHVVLYGGCILLPEIQNFFYFHDLWVFDLSNSTWQSQKFSNKNSVVVENESNNNNNNNQATRTEANENEACEEPIKVYGPTSGYVDENQKTLFLVQPNNTLSILNLSSAVSNDDSNSELNWIHYNEFKIIPNNTNLNYDLVSMVNYNNGLIIFSSVISFVYFNLNSNANYNLIFNNTKNKNKRKSSDIHSLNNSSSSNNNNNNNNHINNNEWEGIIMRRHPEILDLRERVRNLINIDSYSLNEKTSKTEINETLSYKEVLNLIMEYIYSLDDNNLTPFLNVLIKESN
eukprot:TRINITY_DN1177_c0_g1_i1.p1 TRINITY_DN1177_c0_g1~~TRINITY_DN1177_c0_g1_i1.p1  ORF type:complete len:565 (+),score=126.59 TRINITY_DN1177_c0_g1_i1:177-1871(+)